LGVDRVISEILELIKDLDIIGRDCGKSKSIFSGKNLALVIENLRCRLPAGDLKNYAGKMVPICKLSAEMSGQALFLAENYLSLRKKCLDLENVRPGRHRRVRQ